MHVLLSKAFRYSIQSRCYKLILPRDYLGHDSLDCHVPMLLARTLPLQALFDYRTCYTCVTMGSICRLYFFLAFSTNVRNILEVLASCPASNLKSSVSFRPISPPASSCRPDSHSGLVPDTSIIEDWLQEADLATIKSLTYMYSNATCTCH